VALDVAGVHAIEIRGKQRGLVAAGAGADFDDRRPIVQRVVGNEEGAEVDFQLFDRRAKPLDFRFGLGGHLGVVNGNELACLRELVLEFSESVGEFDNGAEPLVLSPQGGQPPRILGGRRIGEFAFDFGGARYRVRQTVAETQADLPAYF
jgi:hypothetical protein